MRKIFLCAVFLFGSYLFFAPTEASAQCNGYVYTVSIVGYKNQPPQQYVFGFEAEAIDYYLAICYDPEIYGYLDEICSPNGEGALDYDHDIGFAEWIPAQVFLFSTQYHSNSHYTSLGDLWLRHWYYGTRYYLGYTGVCIGTPPPCDPISGNGAAVPCSTIPPTPTPTPTPTPPTVQVQEVGFTGDHLIRRFGANLDPPQYIDNPDGSTPTWV